jgi:phasin
MTKDGLPNFEIPPEMRAMAEKSVTQAKQAFESFVSAAQQAVHTAENQANTVRSGAKEVGAVAMKFAERNIAASFEFAQKILHAKDPQEAAKLHAEFVKSQLAAFTEQTKEFAQHASKLAGH